MNNGLVYFVVHWRGNCK